MTGIVLCGRANSSRVPGKAFKLINGVPMVDLLLERLLATGLLVVLAMPLEDEKEYAHTVSKFTHRENFRTFVGFAKDPLKRMASVAEKFKLETVIRVSQDKIFVEPNLINHALSVFQHKNLDYLFSSQFTPGSGFEVIRAQTIADAASKYSEVEHISYAIRSITDNIYDWPVNEEYRSRFRLLIDYPQDLTLMDLIFSTLGNSCNLFQAIDFMTANPWAEKINKLPVLTVYTCCYNSERFIEKCMGSVAEQKRFKEMEYILVDDCSTDRSTEMMAKFSTRFNNVRFTRNQKNLGLASSSNIALDMSRGDYILRLDADDYLVGGPSILDQMLTEIKDCKKDVIYPNNYFGSRKKIQDGRQNHHPGGAIFESRALNHVRFTDALRHYDGLDLYTRARNQLQIGYFGKPAFFYRQRKGSLSKSNLAERKEIKDGIERKSITLGN